MDTYTDTKEWYEYDGIATLTFEWCENLALAFGSTPNVDSWQRIVTTSIYFVRSINYNMFFLNIINIEVVRDILYIFRRWKFLEWRWLSSQRLSTLTIRLWEERVRVCEIEKKWKVNSWNRTKTTKAEVGRYADGGWAKVIGLAKVWSVQNKKTLEGFTFTATTKRSKRWRMKVTLSSRFRFVWPTNGEVGVNWIRNNVPTSDKYTGTYDRKYVLTGKPVCFLRIEMRAR